MVGPRAKASSFNLTVTCLLCRDCVSFAQVDEAGSLGRSVPVTVLIHSATVCPWFASRARLSQHRYATVASEYPDLAQQRAERVHLCKIFSHLLLRLTNLVPETKCIKSIVGALKLERLQAINNPVALTIERPQSRTKAGTRAYESFGGLRFWGQLVATFCLESVHPKSPLRL